MPASEKHAAGITPGNEGWQAAGSIPAPGANNKTTTMVLNRIYNEDCLEGIGRIPTGSIQTVICDPPYFCGMTHNGRKGTFGDLNVSKPFFAEIFREIARVLTDTGCVYWFCDWRTYPFYFPLFDSIIGVDNLLTWDKIPGRVAKKYWSNSELIVFHAGHDLSPAGEMRNVLRYKIISSTERDHPTQKPVELIARLITDSTAKGDTILDCFMGSGTTAVAAMRTGRRFVGFEIDENYHAIALRRIEQERQQLKLAL